MRVLLAALALAVAPVALAQAPAASSAATPFAHEKGRFAVVNTAGWTVETKERGAVFVRAFGEAQARCEAMAITTPRTAKLKQERIDLSVRRFSMQEWRKLVSSISVSGVRFQGPDSVAVAELGADVGKRASWKQDQDKTVFGEGLYFAAPGLANLVMCSAPKGNAEAAAGIAELLSGFRRNDPPAPKA
jgi:hypothetical protein